MCIAFIHVFVIPQRNEFHKKHRMLLFKGTIRISKDVSCFSQIWRWKCTLVCVRSEGKIGGEAENQKASVPSQLNPPQIPQGSRSKTSCGRRCGVVGARPHGHCGALLWYTVTGIWIRWLV